MAESLEEDYENDGWSELLNISADPPDKRDVCDKCKYVRIFNIIVILIMKAKFF